MYSRRTAERGIPGDYQYRALHEGPISQRLWHGEKLDLVASYARDPRYGRICDAGCGSGIVASHVARLRPDAEVVAVDVNAECIAFARRQYRDQTNLSFLQRDLRSPAGEPARFDLVYSTEVIEHFTEDDARRYLRTLRALGHARTTYLLTTPDYASLWPLLERGLDALRLVPTLRDHQHLTRFTRGRLEALVRAEGLRVTRMFNFCGWSPFVGHVSTRVSRFVRGWERRRDRGFLIACECAPAGPAPP